MLEVPDAYFWAKSFGFFLLISSKTTKTRFASRPSTKTHVALLPLHLSQPAHPHACAGVFLSKNRELFFAAVFATVPYGLLAMKSISKKPFSNLSFVGFFSPPAGTLNSKPASRLKSVDGGRRTFKPSVS